MAEEGIGAKGLKTKLIINYLPQSMTDGEFKCLFGAIGELESHKIMRDNNTGYSYGYGFIDYSNPTDAETAISKLSGYKILNKTLRVAYSKPPGASKNANLYISGLKSDIDEQKLEELFGKYGEIVQTRLLRNNDGTSKQVAFVLFKQKEDAEEAMNELSDQFQIKFANPSDQQKSHPKYQEFIQQKMMQQQQPLMGGMGMGYNPQQMSPHMAQQSAQFQEPYGGGYGSNLQRNNRGRDPSARFNPIARPAPGGGMGMGMGMGPDSDSIALFVYNIGAEATDGDLYALFSKYGRINKVDIVEGKGYGFVHMPIPFEANEAMMALNGSFYNGKNLQVSVKNKH